MRSLGGLKCRYNTSKTDLKETGYKMDSPTQDRVQWQALMNTAMKLQFPSRWAIS